MRYFIHIGIHKTASTFLQEQVFPDLEELTLVTRPFTQQNQAFNRLQYADDTLYQRGDVEKELAKLGGDRVLLSDEAFAGKPRFLGNINRTVIAERLQDLVPDADILIFIRGQKQAIMSQYRGYVAGCSGTKPVARFLWKPGGDYDYEKHRARPTHDPRSLYFNTEGEYLHMDCFKYAGLVSLYRRLFSSVHVFLYEELVENPVAVVERIESILGARRENRDATRLRRKVNAGIRGKALSETRFLNAHPFLRSHSLLKRAALKLRSLRSRVASDDADRAYVAEVAKGYYVDDNRELNQMLPELNLRKYPDCYEM